MLTPRLATLLEQSGVAYEMVPEAADLAKTVVLHVDGGYALAVVPATGHLDLEQFLEVSGAQSVMVAYEAEFRSRFPGCEPGAEPPLGELFGVPVWVDEQIARRPEIAFRGGTRSDVVRMRFGDYELLAAPRIARIAR